MHKIINLTVFALLAFASTQALYCNTGYDLESDIITDSVWESTMCPETQEPQSCLRNEGIIIIFSTYRGMLVCFLHSFLFLFIYLFILDCAGSLVGTT